MSDDSNFQLPKNLFWPVLLIGVGFILLFSNLGLIPTVNLVLIFRMWPLLLIGLGLNLLFGRDNPSLGNIISIVLVIIAILFMLFAQNLGVSLPNAEYITENFSEKIGEAESANIDINVDTGALTIDSLADSSSLIEGESHHNMDLTFKASGSQEKDIYFDLSQDDFGFGFDFGFMDFDKPETSISLSPDVPMDLNVDLGSGTSELDLSDLTLTDLEADTGSGRLTLTLPSGDFYADLGAGSGSLEINTSSGSDLDLVAVVGSGRMTIDVAEKSQGTLEVKAGSGTITVYVPEGVGVEVTGAAGSGSVRTPSGYVHIGTDEFVTSSGTWYNPDNEDAKYQITIQFSIGSGTLVIKEK